MEMSGVFDLVRRLYTVYDSNQGALVVDDPDDAQRRHFLSLHELVLNMNNTHGPPVDGFRLVLHEGHPLPFQATFATALQNLLEPDPTTHRSMRFGAAPGLCVSLCLFVMTTCLRFNYGDAQIIADSLFRCLATLSPERRYEVTARLSHWHRRLYASRTWDQFEESLGLKNPFRRAQYCARVVALTVRTRNPIRSAWRWMEFCRRTIPR